MRKLKPSFQNLINENKNKIQQDRRLMDEIEERIDYRHEHAMKQKVTKTKDKSHSYEISGFYPLYLPISMMMAIPSFLYLIYAFTRKFNSKKTSTTKQHSMSNRPAPLCCHIHSARVEVVSQIVLKEEAGSR
ncbi:FbpB family small basic protein (plasmid) [Bacillus megaterium]|nr:FbpB family small basic protein [Priestia megaterium]